MTNQLDGGHHHVLGGGDAIEFIKECIETSDPYRIQIVVVIADSVQNVSSIIIDTEGNYGGGGFTLSNGVNVVELMSFQLSVHTSSTCNG